MKPKLDNYDQWLKKRILTQSGVSKKERVAPNFESSDEDEEHNNKRHSNPPKPEVPPPSLPVKVAKKTSVSLDMRRQITIQQNRDEMVRNVNHFSK